VDTAVLPKFNHLLVVFGGVGGLEAALQVNPFSFVNPNEHFYIKNTSLTLKLTKVKWSYQVVGQVGNGSGLCISVADPRCLFWIPDLNFSSRIQVRKDSGSGQRI
jgi:hypothetical protein